MGNKKKLSYRLWFIPVDFVVVFGIMFFMFLANIGFSGFLDTYMMSVLIYCGVISLFTVGVFTIFKVYKMITSDFGLVEAITMFVISLGIQIVGLFVIIFVPQLPEIGRIGWSWLLATVAMGFALPSLRLLVRVMILFIKVRRKKDTVRTLVIGAGSAGKIVIDESRKNINNHCKVVAFIDDDPNKINRTFAGVPVVGPISKINSYIELYDVEEVIIAITAITEKRKHELFELLKDAKVRVRRMPTLDEMQGPNDRQIVDVKLEELLSRPSIKLDNSGVTKMLKDQVVMVTGAGGSIGSELVRQIYNTEPKTLILFDIYENSTYDIQQELMIKMREDDSKLNLITIIGSTYDAVKVERVIKKYKPNYIYHAAAYKHVPLMEDAPEEAIRTNVLGTYNVAKFADKYGVNKMVLVSTDKAVRPTNTMGATKRFAETIIQYFADKSKNTAYAAVRFGNVLGSNGSVVPLFQKQIAAGGPVTLTHKDIIRYFMTIPEAVALILQCGLFAQGGEIFILDMGEPVKIYDLAERLIRQAGLTPGKDIEILETGLRPGEKLYEELLLDKTIQTKTKNNLIYIEPKDTNIKPIEKEMAIISKAFELDSTDEVKKLLATIIETYVIDIRKTRQ